MTLPSSLTFPGSGTFPGVATSSGPLAPTEIDPVSTPERLAHQTTGVRVRHVTMCDPGDDGAVEVLGKHYRGDWGINGTNGWQNGSFSLRIGEEGDFVLELPNAVGSDGRSHLDRLEITRIGRARPVPGGILEYDGGAYRPGDEWFEIWEVGAERPAFVGTPTKATVTKTKITVAGWDAMWMLKKTRETQAGFWNAPPRDVIEHYTGLWDCIYADTLRSADHPGRIVTGGVSFGPTGALLTGPRSGEEALTYLSTDTSGSAAFPAEATGIRFEICLSAPRTGESPVAFYVSRGGEPFFAPENVLCSMTVQDGGSVGAGPVIGGVDRHGGVARVDTATVSLAVEIRAFRCFYYVNGTLALISLLDQAFTGDVRPFVLVGAEGTVTATDMLTRVHRPFLLRGDDHGSRRIPGAPPPGGLYAQYVDAADDAAKGLTAEEMLGPQKDFVPRVEPVAFARTNPITWQAPGIPSNNFAVRWSGAIYLDLARADRQVGITEFYSAGRCRVSVAGVTMIDFPASGSAVGPAMRSLLGSSSGWYPIVIEATYIDGGSGGGLQLLEGPLGSLVVAPTSILSPYGVVNEQIRNDSHYDALKSVAETFGYQITCEPRSLESGEFPGQIIPRIRHGVDTAYVLDEPTAWNLSDAIDAEGVADAWVADAAGIATADNAGQLTAEMVNFDEATRHLGLLTESESLAEISQRPLLEQRLRSLVALSAAPWEEVSVDADGYRSRVDIWPLPSTGSAGETRLFDWAVGDGVRLVLPSLGVVDEAPRQIMGITRDFNPSALKPPRAAFRQRPRDLAATLRILKQKAVLPQRNPQGSVQVLAGAYGSNVTGAAPDAFSRLWVPPSARVSRAEAVVVLKSGSARYDLEVNGVVVLSGLTQTGSYDVTTSIPASLGYVYARLIGSAGEQWIVQLQVTARV